MAEVVFVDSSVLLNLLDVPGKNSDRGGVTAEFKAHAASGVTLIIPMAAVVEVGNHIAQLPGHDRRDRATCSNEIGGGDASILHELYRYRSRTDLPGALPVRLWTLDRGLAAYA